MKQNFNLLIVEDNSDKLRNILQILKDISGIEIDDIDHEVDSFSAKKKLKSQHYDLLILDIAIPSRKSETIDMEGGIKLLKEILLRDIYKVPTHIIGLTALQAVFSKATSEFESALLSVIRYSNTDIEWQAHLKKGVEQRVLSKVAARGSEQAYIYDICIITALDKEFAAVKALSKTWNKIDFPFDSSPYFETHFEKDEKKFSVVAACAPQMGMNASAILSMKLIYNFRPKYLFMTGIAASIKDVNSHGYGDILVVDESWDGGAGKIIEDDTGHNVFLPIAQHLRLDKDISEKMRTIKDNEHLLRQIKDGWKPHTVPNTELSVHIGSVVSVAGVVENHAVIQELKSKDRKLLGLEMEVYGMYYSASNCGNPKPIAIAIKSVADFAMQGKNDIYQNYASYTSAQVMYEFIMSEL